MIQLRNGRLIGLGEPCFLVAELGQNHQGDVYTALRLTAMAQAAGCDAVKLCKRHLPGEMTAAQAARPYHGPHSFGDTYGAHREHLELPIRDYVHLHERIAYNGWDQLTLFATVCHPVALDEIESHVDPPLYKIASRDLDNLPLIHAVAATGKPVILSTGMVRDRGEIERAIQAVRHHHDQLILLYCVSRYPCPDDAVHLREIAAMKATYQCDVGFSDHTVGIHLAQAAVAIGACVIEKHVTFSRAARGSDHAGSLEPRGLAAMVRNIRSIEAALSGSPSPAPDPEVLLARAKLARSLTSRVAIPAGTPITEEMITLKSPGTGLPWHTRWRVLGSRARVAIPADVTLTEEMITDGRV